MELNHLFSLQVLFTSLLFMFMVLRTWHKSKAKNSNPNLPPGPWKLPLMGNMHNFIGDLPHRCLGHLAKVYGPLMHLKLGEISTIVVSSPEAAKEVMKTHDAIFAQRPHFMAISILTYDCTSIGFAPYGDYWRQLRKICTLELLTSKRVQSFQAIREEEVSNVLTFLFSNAGMPINLSEKIFSLTSIIVSRAAFGKIIQDQEEFITLVEQAMEAAGGFALADVFPSYKLLHKIGGQRSIMVKLHHKLHRILQNIVDEHKAIKARTNAPEAVKGLVHVLLNFQQHSDLGFALSDDNIKSIIQEMFGAGMDPTSTTIDWAMSEMLKNPSVMEKAQAEVRQVFSGKGIVDEKGLHKLKFLKLVIKETLRLHPPAPLLLPRESMENCEIFGYDIPVKTKVIVNAWAIGRDPKYWKDAERFYPERFLDSALDYKGANFQYIPFGSGRRICPGMTFAMANMELPLANFLYHFDWKLHNQIKFEDLDMTEAFGITVKRKNGLFLVPIPYRPV